MYTFDEQSTDRIADSVRWTEKFTSRQARRPEFVHLEAASSTILLGETEQAVSNGGFGTALLFEGAAGSETVGSVQVHFVNATGQSIDANARVWLFWPAIDGDHSAEAESYWYAVPAAAGSPYIGQAAYNLLQEDPPTAIGAGYQIFVSSDILPPSPADLNYFDQDGAGSIQVKRDCRFKLSYTVRINPQPAPASTFRTAPNFSGTYRVPIRVYVLVAADPTLRAWQEVELLYSAPGDKGYDYVSPPDYEAPQASVSGSCILSASQNELVDLVFQPLLFSSGLVNITGEVSVHWLRDGV